MAEKVFRLKSVKDVIFGAGSLNQLGSVAGNFNAHKVFVVIDPFLKETLGGRVTELLQNSGIASRVFAEVTPEPALELADTAARLAGEFQAELVIGIGGGSAMDIAKAAASLVTNGGKAGDYVGVDLVKQKSLPTIMIPTTAGTGSELSRTAVFINRQKKTKGGINSDYLYPDMALLDPELTITVPPKITIYTGFDALIHAIESYVARGANPVSQMYALEAISLISENIRTAFYDGDDLTARSAMLRGSFLAGYSLANAGVGAVHGLSYPLGGEYGIPHGLANSLLLPAVMEFNLPAALEKYGDIAIALGEDIAGKSLNEAAEASVSAIRQIYQDVSFTERLRDFKVPESALRPMAEQTLVGLKRVFDNNPRPVTIEDAVEIYRKSY
jgi:alcohol dehydrogenase class IV